MKKWTDEALQQLIEQEMKGLPHSEETLSSEGAFPGKDPLPAASTFPGGDPVSSEDADLYRVLFKAVSDPPATNNFNVAEAVVNKISSRQNKRDLVFSLILGIAACCLVILLGIIALMTVNASLMNKLFSIVTGAKFIILFALIVACCAWGIDRLVGKRIAVN